MRNSFRGVIFDYSVLTTASNNAAINEEIRVLLDKLKALRIAVVVFSTRPQDIDARLRERGLPRADLFLTSSDVGGARKGRPVWIERAAARLGIAPFKLMYVGDEAYDWRTAVNAAVFYLHAGWARKELPPDVKAQIAARPRQVLAFLNQFLLSPPRWEYTLSRPKDGLHVRSLLHASTVLPSTTPESSFKLQDILTYDRTVLVRKSNAKDLLMLHALSSLSLEGLIPPNSLFTVYPSSNPGTTSPISQGFMGPAAKFFHGYYKEDLLVRAVQARDTSHERASARREGRVPRVSLADQANTVHVNPAYESSIRSKESTVLVFDDFTTTGRSLEWARNLLYAAGATRVILLTVGKYGSNYFLYRPNRPGIVQPFELTDYDTAGDFTKVVLPMERNRRAPDLISASFERLKENKSYPTHNL
ncbi:MAG: HAD hydrolase-like protein [Actinomycetota bacterium]|nr:HAD hydrolase-like protein [Actinomycetota bacterium]